MKYSIMILLLLLFGTIAYNNAQTAVPLQYAIVFSGCDGIQDEGCITNDQRRNCSQIGSFLVDKSTCVLNCYFSSGVNQITVNFEGSGTVSVDSFVASRQDSIFRLNSTVEHRELTITITPHAQVNSIKYNFIPPVVTTVSPDATSPLDTLPTTSAIINPSDETTSSDLTSTIVIVAVILGILLMLVACSIFALTFAVLFKTKKKHQSPLRIHSLNQNTPNMYEASTSSIGEGFKKMDHGSLSLERPKPPTDPEYATVSEWKQMAGMSEKPVHNPFYDSSFSLNIHKGMAAIQVPQLEWSGSAWDNSVPPCSDTPIKMKMSADSSLPMHRQLSKSNSMRGIAHGGKFDPYEGSHGSSKYVVANSIQLKSQGDLAPMHIMTGEVSDTALPYSTSPTHHIASTPAPTSPPPPPPSGGTSKARPSLPSKQSKKLSLNRHGSLSASRNQIELEGKAANYIIPNGKADPSPLVHNHRAIKKSQSNEIVNSEYAVTGFKQHHQ